MRCSQKQRHTFLTDEGATKIEKAFGIDNLYDPEHAELLHHVSQSLKAHAALKRDVDYIVKEGKIELIDKFTGRVMEGRTFSEGLHQAIEAKEGLEITEENETQATITIQNYFRLYSSLAGMTGSATPSKSEFWDTYGLPVVTIPTNRPVIREDLPDLIYKDQASKIKKIVAEVKKIHSLGRPILIGTTSIEQSETLSNELTKEKITHQVLNAKTEADEAEIIAKAGQKSQVMIATNMAGRGTDILLEEEVKELGGLYIIGTERHESGRIDMQLRGRAGRQGDPGTSQFIISLEDDLFTYYDKDEHERYLKKVKSDDEGIVTAPAPDKYMKKVQETIEYMHQAARNHLLKLENPLNEQSKIIYTMRDRLLDLEEEEMFPILLEYIEKYVRQLVSAYFAEEVDMEEGQKRNLDAFIKELSQIFGIFRLAERRFDWLDRATVEERVLAKFEELTSFILNLQENAEIGQQLRRFMLQQIDMKWMDHLDRLSNIKEGINLSGYGQQDPYQLFEKEALVEFNILMNEIESGISVHFMEYIMDEVEEEVEES